MERVGKKSEKKFGPGRPPEGAWEGPEGAGRGLGRRVAQGPAAAIQETFSILGAVLEPQSRGVLV